MSRSTNDLSDPISRPPLSAAETNLANILGCLLAERWAGMMAPGNPSDSTRIPAQKGAASPLSPARNDGPQDAQTADLLLESESSN